MKIPNGFTLVELLVVLSIIGVLASILLPILINARISASKRAIQAHSAILYKVATAIQAEEPEAILSTIAEQIELNCNSNTTSLVISNKTFLYGWLRPTSVGSCTVDVDINDFKVVVQGDASTGNKSSTNGQAPL